MVPVGWYPWAGWKNETPSRTRVWRKYGHMIKNGIKNGTVSSHLGTWAPSDIPPLGTLLVHITLLNLLNTCSKA